MEETREPGSRARHTAELIFDKGAEAFQWRKDGLSTNGAGAAGHP